MRVRRAVRARNQVWCSAGAASLIAMAPRAIARIELVPCPSRCRWSFRRAVALGLALEVDARRQQERADAHKEEQEARATAHRPLHDTVTPASVGGRRRSMALSKRASRTTIVTRNTRPTGVHMMAPASC